LSDVTRSRRAEATALPAWIKPQLTKLVDAPPDGPEWFHEIKLDGYQMHARAGRGPAPDARRARLDAKYPAIAAAIASLPARQAYLDGELCGIRPDSTIFFSPVQNASGETLVFPVRSASPPFRSVSGCVPMASPSAGGGKAAASIQRSPDRARPGLQ
jgi:ATP-dependent DNA ligase